MKIQEHIGKISWSIADKVLFIIYGFVMLFQMKALSPYEFGLYGLLISFHTWIFLISDSFALQIIIQFGTNPENRGKVNTIALILHVSLVFFSLLLLWMFSGNLAELFHEPNLNKVTAGLPLLLLLFIPRTYCLKFIFRDSEMHKLFFVNLAFFGTMTLMTIYLLSNRDILYFKDMYDIYIAGSVLSSIVAILLTFKKLVFSLSGNIKISKVLKFGLPLAATASLHSLPKQLDLYILKLFFPTEVIGIYYSAKNLFRVFEETVAAAGGLVYPAAVRQYEKGNKKEFHDLMTKSVSFLFVSFLLIFIILQLGFSDLFIRWFLPPSYLNVIGQFNLIMIAALALPFVMLTNIINATGKPILVLKFVILSLIFSLISYFFIGMMGLDKLMSLGFVIYYLILGVLSFDYVRKIYQFTILQIFRIGIDFINYYKTKLI